MTEDIFFRMEKINKFYPMGDEQAHILKDIDLEIRQGEYLSVLGPSGSGKSTLMNIIGCLDTPTSGAYVLRNREIMALEEQELAAIRSREIGFIFQNSQLLPRLTALKNVELPLIMPGFRPGSGSGGLGKCWKRWASATGWSIIPTSSPAASSSG